MATNSIPTALRGERVTIRKPRLSDAAGLQVQVSRPEIVRWTLTIPHPYPEDGARRFLRSVWREWAGGSGYTFTILINESPSAAGVVSLSGVSPRHGCAELGYWLGSGHWGRGYMTEAAGLALQFAFQALGMHRVYASTFEGNIASRRVLEKNGFTLEGTMREAIVREGRRHDFLNYGILRREFRRGALEAGLKGPMQKRATPRT